MATQSDRFMNAAVRSAKRAKKWAVVAAREADRLVQEGRKRAESGDPPGRLRQALLKTGRVLKTAGRWALVAAVAAGIAAARAERNVRKLPKGRRR